MAGRELPKPDDEGLTPENLTRFLKLTDEGMEAEEAAIARATHHPGKLSAEEQEEVDDYEQATFGFGRLVRSGVLTLIVVLALIVAGTAWLTTRDSDGTTKPTTAPGNVVPDAATGSTVPTGDSISVPPAALVGSWVDADGSTGYELRSDGTYTMATLDSSIDGRYRVSGDGNDAHIVFLDPNDPTGQTALMIADYRLDGDSLWMNLLGSDREFVPGEIPVPGDTAPPVATLEAATASSMNGRIEASQPITLPGLTTTVSQTVDVTSVSGSVTIDAVNGEVEGRLEAHYECPATRCDEVGETASGDVVIDVVDTRPSTYMQDTWAYEGAVHVRVVFNATSVVIGTSQPWSWVQDLDGTYTVGLEREWAVFDLNLRVPDSDEVIALQVIGPTS